MGKKNKKIRWRKQVISMFPCISVPFITQQEREIKEIDGKYNHGSKKDNSWRYYALVLERHRGLPQKQLS